MNESIKEKCHQLARNICGKVVFVGNQYGGIGIIVSLDFKSQRSSVRQFQIMSLDSLFSLGNAFVDVPEHCTWEEMFVFLEENTERFSYWIVDVRDVKHAAKMLRKEPCEPPIPTCGNVVICNVRDFYGMVRPRLAIRHSTEPWNHSRHIAVWSSVNEKNSDEWPDSKVESWKPIDPNVHG